MIAADTSRSRVYIQSLVRNNLLPNYVLILGHENDVYLPGKIKKSELRANCLVDNDQNDCWSEANNNLSEPIRETLKKFAIKLCRGRNRKHK